MLRASLFLHLRLEHVTLAVEQLVAGSPFAPDGAPVIAVVELLDDLKCPPAGKDVPTDEVAPECLGEISVTRVGELIGRVTEEHIGPADELVERVQVPTRAFEALEALSECAARAHRLVAHARRALPGISIGKSFVHALPLPRERWSLDHPAVMYRFRAAR
jgi:hypothetical protein